MTNMDIRSVFVNIGAMKAPRRTANNGFEIFPPYVSDITEVNLHHDI